MMTLLPTAHTSRTSEQDYGLPVRSSLAIPSAELLSICSHSNLKCA
jgi:hypothetical protein